MASFVRTDSLSAALFFSLVLLLFTSVPPCIGDDSETSGASAEQPEVNYVDKLKEWIANAMDSATKSLKRQLLSVDLSTQCSLGLVKFVRGIRNLEPWAVRLLDATGKFPTGALQMSRADLGAFDECVETVVLDSFGHESARGQYCNLQVYAGNISKLEEFISSAIAFTHPRIKKFSDHIKGPGAPFLSIGICAIDACSDQEIQSLIKAVLPPVVDIAVSNCVTAIPPGWTKAQLMIAAFLATLALTIILGSYVDVKRSRGNDKSCNTGGLLSFLVVFSVVSNTRMILQPAADDSTDSYSLRFLHGVRYLSLTWIVIGRCYVSTSVVWSRMVNTIIYAESWENILAGLGYAALDTFFFLSGFLLAAVVCKQKRSSLCAVISLVVKRYIRTTVPVFFLIMCLYLLPLVTSGPDAIGYFTKVHNDFMWQWPLLLLQVQNYGFTMDARGPSLAHLWYLSLDFQFFLLCLPILILLKNRPKLAVATFLLLSVVGCSVAAWQVASHNMTPFLVALTESPLTFLATRSYYFFYPHYHAVCYFMGCVTFFFVRRYKERKVSEVLQRAAWCIAIAGGLCSICMKGPWYRTKDPTTVFGNLCTAFSDRILWSVFLAWLTFASATERGGFVSTFLSWGAFAPLSRLANGVYIIHAFFIGLTVHISRERMFFSHFVVVSFSFTVLVWSYMLGYLLFVFCEAPTDRLGKLIFEPRLRKANNDRNDEALNANGPEEKLICAIATLGNSEISTASCKGKSIFNDFHYASSNLASCHL
ncbi:nose resistant to fluoxetine protein 6-like [Amblyomma americanum]